MEKILPGSHKTKNPNKFPNFVASLDAETLENFPPRLHKEFLLQFCHVLVNLFMVLWRLDVSYFFLPNIIVEIVHNADDYAVQIFPYFFQFLVFFLD